MPKPGSQLPGFSFLPLWALAGSRDVNPGRNLICNEIKSRDTIY